VSPTGTYATLGLARSLWLPSGDRWHSCSMSPEEPLSSRIGKLCRLTGKFTLRSGQVSDTYFDKYLFESDPRLLREIADQAVALIPPGTEVLAGLELGGVPIAIALSLATGIPAVFVRKEPQPYGTRKLAEGIDVKNRRTLIVEDVITTGGQVAASAVELRERGARIESVLCIIDRSHGDHSQLDQCACSVISLLTSNQLV